MTALATWRLQRRLLKGLIEYDDGARVAARVEEGDDKEEENDKVWHGSTGEGGYEVFFVRVSYMSAEELNQLFAGSDRRCRFQWEWLDSLMEEDHPNLTLPLHPRLEAIHDLPAIWSAIADKYQLD